MYAFPGGELTPEHDVYLALVVTVMFLAGCLIAVVNRYRRTRQGKEW
jgi:hypothetical protein